MYIYIYIYHISQYNPILVKRIQKRTEISDHRWSATRLLHRRCDQLRVNLQQLHLQRPLGALKLDEIVTFLMSISDIMLYYVIFISIVSLTQKSSFESFVSSRISFFLLCHFLYVYEFFGLIRLPQPKWRTQMEQLPKDSSGLQQKLGWGCDLNWNLWSVFHVCKIL